MVEQPNRLWKAIRNGAGILLILVALRELLGILSEYRFYFPPDFQSSGFLAGRENFFRGTYRIAFYLHIVAGPLAILLATYLVWSGTRNVRIRLHRTLGKIQFLLVLFLAPSGLMMATRTYTGALAGTGFAILATLTFAAMIMALVHVRRGEINQHRIWATRLFIMLLSPLLLRMISSVSVLVGTESERLYQFSAWGSWLVPLLAYELAQRIWMEKSNDTNFSSEESTATLENYS